MHPPEPAGEQRTDQRAGGERGVEHPGGLRPAAEDLLGERREQRPRHREDHRDEVDDEGHEQHLPGAQEAQPLQHAGRPGPAPAALRAASPAAPRTASSAAAKRHRVQPVRRLVAVAARPARRRAAARRSTPRLNSTCSSALAAGSSSGGSSRGTNACRAGRVDREQRRLHGDDGVEQPGLLQAEHAPARPARPTSSACPAVVRSTSRRRSTASAIAPPYSPNTMSGSSPARPTRPTATAEPVCVVDLERHRDGRHLGADDRDGVADQQAAVRAGDPQRREVEGQRRAAGAARCPARTSGRPSPGAGSRLMQPVSGREPLDDPGARRRRR